MQWHHSLILKFKMGRIMQFIAGKFSKKKIYLLLFFPLVFCTLQFLLKADYKYYFTSAYDPAYAFLFNGLNLAGGDLGSGLAGFPGTPLQIFVALMIRFGYLFRNATPLLEDVLTDPEYYLNMAGNGIILLNTLAILLSGTILFNHTKNLTLSLAIQLVPFLSVTGLHFGSVVMCEPFLVFAIQCIALQLALYCFGNRESPGNRQILFLSLFTAIGLTTKIVMIPVLLLPLVVIRGRTDILKYIFITIVISAVLLIPAYPDWKLFVNWFKLLLFHKGIYGHGESGVVDIGLFMSSIKEIFTGDLVFTFLFVLILSFLFMRFIPGVKEYIRHKNYRIVAGVFVVIMIQLLMVGKHYLPHYMISMYSLIMTGLLFSLSGFKKSLFLNQYVRWFNPLAVMLAGVLLIIRFMLSFHFSPGLKHPFTETVGYINNNAGEGQKIIVKGFSSAYKEYGLYFGMTFSSRSMNKYKPVLKKLYPDTYFYSPEQERYFDWNSDISLIEILSQDDTTYISTKSRTDPLAGSLLEELNYLKKAGPVKSFYLEYKNPMAFDYLYKIISDTNALKGLLAEKETILCDCESISKDGNVFISSDGKFLFEKAYMRSSEKVHSGNYAVKLDENSIYALDIKLGVSKHDYIKTYAWRNSQDNKVLIVLTDDMPDGIYSAGAYVVSVKDSWERVNMNFTIPGDFMGEEIHLYLWYNGKDSCYLDDFKIEIYKGMPITDQD